MPCAVWITSSSRPDVDTNRLAVAGFRSGGETTMYVAALDERLKLACSSGLADHRPRT